DRPVFRGLYSGAEARRRERRLASGLADVRDVRLRLPVRLRRPSGRGPAGSRDRRAAALRAAQLPGKSVLYRCGRRLMSVPAPRQLALALDHAESFAREDFLGGPGNAVALALIESWPD